MTTPLPLTHIEIDGFRGLRRLALGPLSRVNVLVGGNNSGKTSVLEAISILAKPTQPAAWIDMIRWRDPAVKADHDGYTAARKELQEKRQAALDIIKIDDPKAGLDAIKALEAWEPSKTA